MQPLFITATNTNVGKTYTTLRLIDALSKRGYRVGVFKPIETGVIDEPQDAQKLLESVSKHNPYFARLSPKDITAYTFRLPAAPFCAGEGIKLGVIFAKFQELSRECDMLLIEGAGGLMVPIFKEYFMIDLIKDLSVKTLLVASSKLGTINDTMLSLEALKSRSIDFEWVVNLHEDKEHFTSVTQPFFDAYFGDFLRLPEDIDRLVERLIRENIQD